MDTKKILMLLAVIAAMWSCSSEDLTRTNSTDNVTLVLSTSIPPKLSSSTRTAILGGSNKGGVDNIDWNVYQLRYILEAYDDSDNLVGRQIKYKTSDIDAKAENFSLQLIPGKTYKIVCWADFIKQGGETDFHYGTSSDAGLKNITMLNGQYTGNDDSRDAYFAQEEITINNNLTKTITLQRPFGKIRVISTDASSLDIDKIQVNYTTDLPAGIDASTGKLIANSKLENVTYTSEISAAGNEGTVAGKGMTILFDYILAPPTSKNSPVQEVHNFKITVYKSSTEVSSYNFTTGIPVERNHLTTIRGNLFTNHLGIGITVAEDFDGETEIDNDVLNTLGYCDIDEIDWNKSNVWKVMNNGQQVAEIAKEAIVTSEGKYQIIAVYPMKDAEHSDVTSGLITQVINVIGSSINITTKANSSIAWSPREIANAYDSDNRIIKKISWGNSSNFTMIKVMTDKVEKVTDTSNLNKLTLKPYIIKDIDNNIYPVTKIGATYWLRENLRVTHYNNGTPLINRRNATDNDLANGAETQEAVRMFEKAPMYDWYRNIDTNFDAGDSEATKKLYGLSYNLRAVAGDDDPWINLASNDNTQGSLSQRGDSNINEAQTNLQLCPIGWHIATNGVSSFGNNTPDVQYIDDFFVWQWIHMMTDNYASIGTERNLNTAQWPYNTIIYPHQHNGTYPQCRTCFGTEK